MRPGYASRSRLKKVKAKDAIKPDLNKSYTKVNLGSLKSIGESQVLLLLACFRHEAGWMPAAGYFLPRQAHKVSKGITYFARPSPPRHPYSREEGPTSRSLDSCLKPKVVFGTIAAIPGSEILLIVRSSKSSNLNGSRSCMLVSLLILRSRDRHFLESD